MGSILIVTNDLVLERMLSVTLTINGFSVLSTKNTREAKSILSNGKISMFLIDQDVDQTNLGAFLESLKSMKLDVPVLLLGNKREGWHHVTKPVEFPALKLKMNELFKKKKTLAEKIIFFGDMKIDVVKRVVTVKDSFIELGMMELAILIALARKSGQIVARTSIRDDLEAQGIFFNSAIQQHISALKKKLKSVGGETFKIKVIVGQGFKLTKHHLKTT